MMEEEKKGRSRRRSVEWASVFRCCPSPSAQRRRGVGWEAGSRQLHSLGAGLVLWNVGVAMVCILIMAAVFVLVLLPTIVLLYAGFLCHSRVLNSPAPVCHYLDDNSCSALIILGFVMMSPLVVVAAATFCGLAHRLRLFLLFQPMARARHRGGGLVWAWDGDVRAWV